MFKKILVCLDGSTLAEQILPYVKEEALRFNSQIILLQVISIPTTIVGPEAPAPVVTVLDQIKQEEIQVAKYLEGVAAPLRAEKIEVTCVTLQGAPGNSILDYAKESSADLLSLATHGRSGVRRLVFGSVADLLLRESGLPMLVIRPKE